MTANTCLRNQSGLPAALVLGTMMSLFLPGAAAGLEQPEYKILSNEAEVEFRQYQAYSAETVLESTQDFNKAANEGFRRLFDYISGSNSKQSKIAMTAPVQQSRNGGSSGSGEKGEKIAMKAPVQQALTADGWRVSFMLPGKYTLQSAPQPSDERVYLRQIPPRLMAVLRYSGRWNEKNIEKYRSRLLAQLQSSGYTVLSEPESAFYNPPFMPPFMRRNEIMVEVAALPE
jgi:transposase